ncbi:MAG: CTP synthase [bacterium]|nr:CTP synthase [bacterium]
MTKYVFVTGGNVSSIGKGIISASLGLLLKAQGYKVTVLKFDPYINVDAGTMNPIQHGEVFVTDDGAETDLDLGHYERFIDEDLAAYNNATTGQIYNAVISKERTGEYLGRCVQVIPHITDEIKSRIRTAAGRSRAEIVIVEVGGTIGDIEGLPFLEAIRQFKKEVGHTNTLSIHVTLIPHLESSGELKTKLTQHTVIELRSIGLSPDIIVCRTSKRLTRDVRSKIALFCDVQPECVIEGIDAPSIYDIPALLEEQGFGQQVTKMLGLESRRPDMTSWERMRDKLHTPNKSVRVAVVGKYNALKDAYLSILESMMHAAINHRALIEFVWIDAERLTRDTVERRLRKVDGLLIPYGFGYRGMEGKIEAIRYARENGLPFFGLCVGLQVAVIEFARNVCGLGDANSTEFDADTPHPVIDLMETQRDIEAKGGTMRLGAWPAKLGKGTLAAEAYGTSKISERHRHRWEINPKYHEQLQKSGLVFSGTSPDGRLVEIVELKNHPFFLAVQYHPEFKGRPTRPHPLFNKFVERMIAYRHKDVEVEDEDGIETESRFAGAETEGGPA